MKNLIIVCALLVISCLTCFAGISEFNRPLLTEVKELYPSFEKLKKHRHAVTDSMIHRRDMLENSEERVILSQEIARRYRESDMDSALMFLQLARREAESLDMTDKSLELYMSYLAHYPLIGPGIEVLKDFNAIDPSTMSPELRKKYWENAARMNYYILRRYPNGVAKSLYRQRTIEAYDSLLDYFPPQSMVAGLISARLLGLRGETSISVASLLELLPSLTPGSEDYEEALRTIIAYYSDKPSKQEEYLHYLLEYTTINMKKGIVRPEYLAETGKILYDEGERRIGRDLILLAMSYDDNRIGYSRTFNYPKYISYLSAQTTTVRRWLAVMIVAMVITIALLLYLTINRARKIKSDHQKYKVKIKELHNKIADTEKIANGANAMSFLLHSQLNDFNVYVARKLKAGQIKDLYTDIENGTYNESQREKFYAAFDELVLTQYPDFIDRLNTLMLPGKELSLLPGKRLTPELRIAAYMRFGITDSARLAEALGLSVNTIYTYRNRLKGRAADRNSFEKNIAALYV